uniref:hypothetical protein n=1 Tax=Luteimonas aquatica TaxID=450364 RepID=UPI001F5A29C2
MVQVTVWPLCVQPAPTRLIVSDASTASTLTVSAVVGPVPVLVTVIVYVALAPAARPAGVVQVTVWPLCVQPAPTLLIVSDASTASTL